MNECYQCGKPTINHTPELCNECRAKEDLRRKWENEQYGEDITCPYCGYEDPMSYKLDKDYDADYQCDNCGKTFAVNRFVDYLTYRKAGDMPEGWDGND